MIHNGCLLTIDSFIISFINNTRMTQYMQFISMITCAVIIIEYGNNAKF